MVKSSSTNNTNKNAFKNAVTAVIAANRRVKGESKRFTLKATSMAIIAANRISKCGSKETDSHKRVKHNFKKSLRKLNAVRKFKNSKQLFTQVCNLHPNGPKYVGYDDDKPRCFTCRFGV